MARFNILFICVIKIVCAVKTTTPVWENIDLMVNYLKAFPILKNMTSEELGLPEGVNFKNPKYSPTAPSVIEKPTLSGTKNPLTLITSAHTSQSATYDQTKLVARGATTSSEVRSISNYKEISATPTYFSNFSSRQENASEIKEVIPTTQSPVFMCYECERNLLEKNYHNCTMQHCPSKRCIDGFVRSFRVNRTGDKYLLKAVSIQKCDTGNIMISDLKSKNITIETKNSLASTRVMLNVNCTDVSNFIPLLSNHGDKGNNLSYEVNYYCCNFTLCNYAKPPLENQFHVSQEDYSTKKVITQSNSATTQPDAIVYTTSLTSSIPYSTNLSKPGSTFEATTGLQTFTTIDSDGIRTTELEVSGGFSGAISDTTPPELITISASTGKEAHPQTTWHDIAGDTTQHAFTRIQEIPQFPTPGYARDTVSFVTVRPTTLSESSGMHSGSGEFSGNLVQNLASFPSRPTYKLLNVTTQTRRNFFGVATTGITTRLKSRSVTTTFSTSSRIKSLLYEETSAPLMTATNIFEITTSNSLPSSLKKIGSTPAVEGSSQYIEKHFFTKLPQNETTAKKKFEAVTNATHYPTRPDNNFLVSSRPTNPIRYNNERRFDKNVVENYRSRVLLLISAQHDLTNSTFLDNLELNFVTAFEKAKERKTASRKTGILSRKLLLASPSSNIKIDLIMLQRVTNHAVYAEFAVRVNNKYVESSEVVSTMRALTTEELSDILGVAVLSPVIAIEAQPAAAWMISSLTVIPILILLLMLFCCIKFSKYEKTVVKKMEHREANIERYPIYSSKRKSTSTSLKEEAPAKCDLKNLKVRASETKNTTSSALPTVREETSSQSFISEYAEIEEETEETLAEREEIPNVVCENVPSIKEENYINFQTLLQQHKVESSKKPNAQTHHTSTYLPRVSSGTTALVTQTISKDWAKQYIELPEISADGVAEIEADLLRMRTRINTMKKAERSRNKRRIREKISRGNDLKNPYPLDPSVHNPFEAISDFKKGNCIIAAEDGQKTYSKTTAVVSQKEAFTSDLTIDHKQLEKGRKRKRRKLLMAILKDWENRHLQRSHVQCLGPACRLSLDAKMRRWQQPCEQPTITEIQFLKSEANTSMLKEVIHATTPEI